MYRCRHHLAARAGAEGKVEVPGEVDRGESRDIAGPTMPTFSLCYYHDENDSTNSRFRSVIVTH